jgi:hypothetical protein
MTPLLHFNLQASRVIHLHTTVIPVAVVGPIVRPGSGSPSRLHTFIVEIQADTSNEKEVLIRFALRLERVTVVKVGAWQIQRSGKLRLHHGQMADSGRAGGWGGL